MAWAPKADRRRAPWLYGSSGIKFFGRYVLCASPQQKPSGSSRGARFLGFSRSWGGKTMTDRKVLALASPALRRDVARPAFFRQAKRVNRHRVAHGARRP